MKIKLIFFLFLFFIFCQKVSSNINDKIIAKVGNEIVTNFDIINEINTILALSNKKADQNEFKTLQAIAFSSLKKILIKKMEIEKYKITKYNKFDLDNYILSLEKSLQLQDISLKEHFKRYGANYDLFIESVVVNLKWNTLIYSLYQKQLEVDEELIKSELNKQVKKG